MGKKSLILCVILAFGCSQSTFDPPLDEKVLKEVLVDIHIMDAVLKNENGKQRDSLYDLYCDQIRKIHGISQMEFDSTIQYLKSYPEEYNRIYKEVGERINDMKSTTYNPKKAQKGNEKN